MALYEIVGVRCGTGSTTQSITHVAFSANTDVFPVSTAIDLINQGHSVWSRSPYGVRAEVEVVHAPNGVKHIRTKGNTTTVDNLLSLPRV